MPSNYFDAMGLWSGGNRLGGFTVSEIIMVSLFLCLPYLSWWQMSLWWPNFSSCLKSTNDALNSVSSTYKIIVENYSTISFSSANPIWILFFVMLDWGRRSSPLKLLLFSLLFVLGSHLGHSRATPGSVFRNDFLQAPGTILEAEDQDPIQLSSAACKANNLPLC